MKDPRKIIDQLSPQDALAILKTLARDDDQLAVRIAQIATAQLSDVDPDEIAFGLYEELEFLEVEEVWDRAGSTRHGYVEPGEAADQMVNEVVEPYLDELKKLQALGMHNQANRLCMGLLWGLYKFKHESASEFKDWAGDAPSIFAEAVVRAWKEGKPRRPDIVALKTFIEDELWHWEMYLLKFLKEGI